MRIIFEQQPFGELERLVTQKLVEVVKGVARKELANEKWLRRVARLSARTYEQMRVTILEFLDEDVFNLSPANCVAFLQPLIQSWDIDLDDFWYGHYSEPPRGSGPVEEIRIRGNGPGKRRSRKNRG